MTAIPTLVEVACPRCGGEQSKTVATGRDHLYGVPGEFSASECAGCGLHFLNPRPALDELHTLYPAEYTPHHAPEGDEAPRLDFFRVYLSHELGYPAVDAPLRLEAAARLSRGALRREAGVRLVPRYKHDGHLLEIGCASGNRLAMLRGLGWTYLHGIDIVPAAVEAARARGFEATCGDATVELAKLADRSLDVVIASMVLEHFPSPFEVIRLIAQKLKSGGQLLFSTVVRDSWDAKYFGAFWAGYDFPRHMVFLSRADIARMLEQDFTELEEFPQNAPVDFVRSASWRAGERRLVDRLLLAAPERARERVAALLVRVRRTTRASFRCVRR
jgi:SAM-dependent methyltransferase